MGVLKVSALIVGLATLPEASYVRPPSQPVDENDLVFNRDEMTHFYDVPGEFGWLIEGGDYGLAGISIITAETLPGGGPPLHTHDTVEAHVIGAGQRYRVLIDGQVLDVDGPAVVRIPAGAPHTFMNPGKTTLAITGILPGDAVTYTELGPNPLLDTRVPATSAAQAMEEEN